MRRLSSLNRLLEKLLKGFLYAQGYWTLITHSMAKLLEASIELKRHFLTTAKSLIGIASTQDTANLYLSRALYKFYTEEVDQRCLSYAELILNEVKYLRR